MKAFEIIQYRKEQILSRWLAAVKQQIPSSQRQTTPALRNDVPDLLEEAITILNQDTPKERLHESVDHGRLRAAICDYTLSDVIREYRILLEVLFEILDKECTLNSWERNKVIETVISAIEHAAQAFYEIRQDEEIQAKHAAEALVRELTEEGQLRDDFIGTVTHDLRNPMANTLTLLELLKQKLATEPVYVRHLQAIQHSIHKSDTLLHNLLDVNLIKSGGRLPIHPRQGDLMQEVLDVVEEFISQYPGRIMVKESQTSLEGFFDGNALRRALDNLIQNAIKYGDPDGTITIGCHRVDDHIELSVHNWGNPIPIHQQAKIFSRYYQVEEGAQRKGWGIGLSLVKGIAEAHGGKVDLSSSAAEGTLFSIKIPLTQPG